MNAAAAAAADFKNGFGSQFNGLMQPFPDTDTLYSSYSYNNWATKVPSPLGTKTFPWPVNPLTSVVPSNHHQSSVNCFNAASSVTGMGTAGSMLPGTMGGGSGTTAPPCPYTAPPNPYSVYHHRAPAEPCSAMSSSIASLRLKAKQHSSGFVYSSTSPAGRAGSAGLSACQYAGVGVGSDRTVWEEEEGAKATLGTGDEDRSPLSGMEDHNATHDTWTKSSLLMAFVNIFLICHTYNTNIKHLPKGRIWTGRSLENLFIFNMKSKYISGQYNTYITYDWSGKKSLLSLLLRSVQSS